MPPRPLNRSPNGSEITRNSTLHLLEREALRQRAGAWLSASPRPFLRWAGSKRSLLSSIVEVLPDRFGTYREPFLGGGSLFFLLQPDRASLSDVCGELIETYQAVRDDPRSVLRYLTPLVPCREVFYEVRNNRSRGRFKRAAEFIYLNKACWNGLYRVNSLGEFNVPFGAPKTLNVVHPDNLHECSRRLTVPTVDVQCCDFEVALAETRAGDLVFLDPPYVTRHNNNGFIDYNERLFSWEDQERLAVEACRLADLGAHVVVTNAMHHDVIALYDGFSTRTISRASTLASAPRARGRVEEAVFWYSS